MNVVFDFDRTLTLRDTTKSLFFYIGRRLGRSPSIYVINYLLYKIGLFCEYRFKSTLINYYLKGQSVGDVDMVVDEFLDLLHRGNMNGIVVDKLHGHVARKDNVFVASANFDFLIKKFCNVYGVSHYFATQLEVEDEQYTGKICGSIVKGKEKLRVLQEYFGLDELQRIKLYCDKEDYELLKCIPNYVLI